MTFHPLGGTPNSSARHEEDLITCAEFTNMRTLYLDRLKEGLPEITPVFGAFLAEAAAVCLHQMGHRTGVRLKVDGDFETEFAVEWTQEISGREESSWRDLKEATEYGATAIAVLLMAELTGFSSFERNTQDEVMDYNLFLKRVQKGQLAFPDASLEISGILHEGMNNTVQARVSLKKKKANKPGIKNKLPVYVVVVEFGVPKANIAKI